MPRLKPSKSSSSKGKSKNSQLRNIDLKQVEFFIYRGNLDLALKKLVELEGRSSDKLDILRSKIQKSLIFTQMGDETGGLNLADQIIEEGQQIGELVILFDAMIAKSNALFELGELNTCLEVIKTAENILISIKAKDQPDYVKRDSKLKFLKGKIYRKKGELDLALNYLQECFFTIQEYGDQYEKAEILNMLGIVNASKSENDSALGFFKQGLEIFEELENRSQILKLTNNIGMIYQLKGELEQALGCFQKSLALSEKEGDKKRQAESLINIGLIYRNKGDLDPALEYSQKGLRIYEGLELKSELAAFYNNVGVIFQIKGELDEASEYYHRSLDIAEELGDKQEIATGLGNIGDIFQYQGENEKAVSYYKKSLALFEEIGNDINTSRLLVTLIQAHDKDTDQTFYLEKLQKIHSKEENKVINQIYRLGRAIALKSSGRIVDMAEAQQIFRKITQEEVLYISFTGFSMLYLCESLLIEFKATGNEEIIQDIKSVLRRFSHITEKQYSHFWLAHIYWLESRLALLEFDIERSQQLLKQALAFTEEKGLRRLAMEISREQIVFIEQINRWEQIIEQKPSVEEVFELTQLGDLINRMINKRIYRKEEEILDYATKAKELLEKWGEV
ncbi:MAG: tetratricopeptide repeat protein [Candidatus Heimdallarchaeota archaeon]|nr:MAG: tetratricopeptide repeat protein [Candidatus Heimdallarchaeota archaeon]